MTTIRNTRYTATLHQSRRLGKWNKPRETALSGHVPQMDMFKAVTKPERHMGAGL